MKLRSVHFYFEGYAVEYIPTKEKQYGKTVFEIKVLRKNEGRENSYTALAKYTSSSAPNRTNAIALIKTTIK